MALKDKIDPQQPDLKAEPEKRKSLPSNTTKMAMTENFPIVGIGASAGGLEALEQFLGNVPEKSGIAFVIIQHLDPTHKGLMPELLQRSTGMQVIQAKDRLKVKPDCVYVIPPNRNMSILNGALFLFEQLEQRGLRLPIDFFFRSLADDRNEKAIGVILSGMGSDGSLGLQAIKEKGGISLVQSPESSKYDGMPKSAIDAGLADIVAGAAELPGKIISFLKNVTLYRNTSRSDVRSQSSLEKIYILLRTQTGHDFSMYKRNTVYRRIERRMGIHQIEKISGYVRYLQENPRELEILFSELLIGVTSFFRDAAAWENLKDKVLPPMLSKIPGGYVIRAWVPGCSTGEEAYSLAMVLKEAFDKVKSPKNLSFQIFATDLDSAAIEKARKGVFHSNISADVSQERLNRFFIRVDEGYRVKSEIREMIVFAFQDVIKDPPFTRLDIITCRNLLIYLEPALQKRLLALFHYSLLQGGVLLLGNSESPGESAELFQPIEAKLRLFKRMADSALSENLDFPSSFSNIKEIPKDEPMKSKQSINIQTLVDQMLLRQFSPSGVLVNDNGDILYTSGRTGKYLELPVGKVDWNIFAMLRDGLRADFPMAFRRALRQNSPVVLHNVEVGTNGGKQTVDVTLQQIETPEALKGKVMVIFKDVPAVANKKSLWKKSPAGSEITELEQELQNAREGLQSMNEEMQTSQEELKSANEELQSTNEELQSTNEELTTSKEEMQSMNEELQTLNSELQAKVDDLTRIKSDMSNLLNSTEIATLFLDKELRIRQYTSHMTRIIKLIPGDEGRPFTDLVSTLDYPGFTTDALEVLRKLVFIEKTIPTADGSWFKVRIMPYRTVDDRIEGLVITFINITESKILQNELLKTGMMMRSIVDSIAHFIICLSPEGNILEFNSEAEETLGMKRGDIIGKNFISLLVPEAKQKKIAADMAKLIEDSLTEQMEILARTSGGRECRIVLKASRIFDEKGNILEVILIGRKG